jgi:hypothetical protein
MIEPRCVYCSGAYETDDHIPPETFYLDPKPSGLWTVPSCRKCNGGFSKDDEYVRNCFLMEEKVADNPTYAPLMEKMYRGLNRPERPALRQHFRENMRMVDVYSKGGIFLGRKPAYKLDPERILAWVRRVAAGIYFLNREKSVPSGYVVSAYFGSQIEGEGVEAVERMADGRPPVERDGRIFGYKWVQDDGDHDTAFVFMRFFEELYFVCFVAKPDDATTA